MKNELLAGAYPYSPHEKRNENEPSKKIII